MSHSEYTQRHAAADSAEERRLYAGITEQLYKSVDEAASRTSLAAALRAIRHGHEFCDNRVCCCGLSEREYYRTRPDELPLVVCPGKAKP